MKIYCFALLVVLLGSTTSAFARNDVETYSIEEALASEAAKNKIDPNIKLFFGEQTPPKIKITLYTGTTNKKTNHLGKSDKEACQWAFASAIIQLQERARKEGGDAVIKIVSNHRKIERSSETEFVCNNGNIITGVALKGTVVKLEQ